MGKPIPDYGSPNAKIALVGECPGVTEQAKKEPFVGTAGKLLNRLLVSAGIPREECFITNTVPIYASEGISRWLTYNSRGTPQPTADFLMYKEQLLTKLRQSRANVIVPLGKTALYAITGETAITARRGSITTNPALPGKKILPTIHPAAALRNYTYTYYMAYDFQKLSRESEYAEVRLPERELIISPTFEQCVDYLRACLTSSCVAFDIETTRTKKYKSGFQDWEISCLSLSYSKDHAICIPFLDKNRNDYFIPPQEMVIWRLLWKLLTSQNVSKILQNGMFDASFIARKYGTKEQPFYIHPMDDTMVAQGILTPGFQKDLGFLCSLYTDEPYYKDDSKQHTKFDASDTFWEYSAKDSLVLMEIWPKQMALLKRQGNVETYEAATQVMQSLLRMQARGMAVDTLGLTMSSESIGGNIKKLQKELNVMAGKELNANSPPQLKQYFYVTKGAPPITKTVIVDGVKTKVLTTDENAMKTLALRYPEAKIIVDIRKLRKLKGTYIDIVLDPTDPEDEHSDQRLCTSFNPVGTVTGRLSSSKTIFGTGGNMQNLPSIFKSYITADPGYVLYEVDYSQAENRIVAYCGPEPKMIEAFETGKDVHSLTGALISGLDYETVKQQAKDKIPCEVGDGTKTWRDWGKRSNHALNYGMGDKRFGEYADVTRKVASVLKQKYHHAYPGVRQYQSWIEAQLRKDRTITNPLGRKRKFFERWGDSRLFEQAYAHFPQSTVADLINRRALIPLQTEPIFSPAEVLNQIHDSVLLQLPISLGFHMHARLLAALKTAMEYPITWRSKEFSIPVDIKMGLNAGNCVETGIEKDAGNLEYYDRGKKIQKIYEELAAGS